MNNNGSITLVGAGPGDPELITLKAVKAIETASVIFYDALISPALLNYNSKAEKIFVGKRSGSVHTTQSAIDQLIVKHALKGQNVVRLKGGDPLVFGRATEELESAHLHNISTTIIPGISSYAGIAARHQIPITKRKAHQSFWVVTGHTEDGKFADDLYLAAQSSATVIILMGIKHLPEIIALFKKLKTKNYPVAVIQNGTTTAERSLVSTIDKVVEEVESNEIKNPATLFFGPAVTDAVTKFKNPINTLKCII